MNNFFRAERKVEANIRNNEDTKDKDQDDKDNEIEEKLNLNNITKWSITVVENFLRTKDLSELLPLCNGLNGEELLYLYAMCKKSSVEMYHSLKFELLKIHEKVLPISTFLHFVHRLHPVNTSSLLLNRYIYRENLEEYSPDDE